MFLQNILICFVFYQQRFISGNQEDFGIVTKMHNNNNNDILADCLKTTLHNAKLDILWKTSNKRRNILLTDLIDDVLHDVLLNRILIDDSIICEKHIFVNSPNFIVITYLNSIEDLIGYFKCIKYAKHLIFIDDFVLNTFDEITERLFQELWNDGVSDIILGVIKNSTYVKFYTWYPFDGDNMCGNRFKLNLINNCQNLFPIKTNKFLRNCGIQIAFVEAKPFTDLYNKTFSLIGEKVSTEIVFNDKVQVYGFNFYWDKIMKTIFQNESTDVIYGHTVINSTNFHHGPMFYSDRSVIAVRKAPKLEHNRQLVEVFDSYLWILIVFMYLVISGILIIIYLRHMNATCCGIYLDVYRVSLGNSLPQRQFENVTRIVVLFYALYSFIMNTVYLSTLSSLLTKPSYARRIASREDLYINNLSLYFNNLIEKIYKIMFYASDNLEALKHCIILNLNNYELLTWLVKRQQHSIVTFKSLVEVYPHLIERTDYFSTFFGETTLFNSYILKKYNPKNFAINFWATEIVEKGFFVKWWNDMRFTSQLQNYKVIAGDVESPVIVLALKHFRQLFLLIGFGYGFSLIAFLSEFFLYFYMMKINRMKELTSF